MMTKSYSLIENTNGNGVLEQFTVVYAPVKVFTTGGVTVEQFEPDDDLAWQTLSLLTKGFDLQNPGDDELITGYFKAIFRKPHLFNLGTVFANPCAVVRAERFTGHFLELARRFQKEWFLRINDIVHSPARVQRRMNRENVIIRQLTYTGVLVIESRHVFPDCWPDAVRSRGRRTIHPKERRSGPKVTPSSEAAFRQRDTSGVLPSLRAASDERPVVD